jgi:erythromycin esterase-like protein
LKRLIAERGFHLIGIEAGIADGHAIDGYINGSAIDLDTVMASQKFWIYDTEEFREIAR